MTEKTERAVLAGGCFWGMQDLIRKMTGVISTRVGYSGGDVRNATYRNHGTHAEAIEIIFDPRLLSYRQLLEFFFQIHDPSTRNRQGNDVGMSYRSAIYYTSPSRSASPATLSPTSTHRASGLERRPPKSQPPVISGKPSPNIRTISNAIPMVTPVISSVRDGGCRNARRGRFEFSVMAGLVPAIHVFRGSMQLRRGCPGQARA
jgi:methionine-S-sulfoxide reductase